MLQLAEVGVGNPVFRCRLDVAEREAFRGPKMRVENKLTIYAGSVPMITSTKSIKTKEDEA